MHSLADFTETMRAAGYDSASIREWDSNAISQTHTENYGPQSVTEVSSTRRFKPR